MSDLFSVAGIAMREPEAIGLGAMLLPSWALPAEAPLLAALDRVITEAPPRHMVTPGGLRMSVAMTNCGRVGWISDRTGYRYDTTDPVSGSVWPSMPEVFGKLATLAASAAGYADFVADACLINRYVPGTRLTLHQDKNERDLAQPVVSISLGLPAVFQFGGLTRTSTVQRFSLHHGDVVVWGGPSRLFYHGVLPLKDGAHLRLGAVRFNLTFRQAL